MADRNNELLLKLGWERRAGTEYGHIKVWWWRSPNQAAEGKRFKECYTPGMLPRPYDSVDDALACVPEGWESMVGTKERDGKMYGFAYLYRAGQSIQPIIKVRDCPTPAEALAEAISKAATDNIYEKTDD